MMQDPDIILYQHNYYKPLIDKAIKLTEEYVSKNKLILTGGMAIDLALRAKGQSIYSDDTLPDYDIISDKNLDHANELAKILCKEGLPDINVINAVHITTVRVRMKNIVLLDSSYIPPSCFNKIPYMDIGHLRVVHPHYQFIDQRLSLAQLMIDTGISLNIFNRLTKDIKRNNLLRESYPIQSESRSTNDKTKLVSIPLDLIKVDETYLENNKIDDTEIFIYTGSSCISGYLGFMIMMHYLDPTRFQLTLTDTSLEIYIPDDTPIRLLTCNITLIKSFIKKPIIYRPLINLKPITQRDGNYEFVDTYGSRIGCNIIRLDASRKIDVCVASVDYLLMEMLRDRIYIDNEPFTSWYNDLVAVVDKMRGDKNSSLVWWPSLNCYGKDNLPEYRVFMLERFLDAAASKELKPKNSYLQHPRCETKTGFVEKNSHYFMIDGEEDKTIVHTNYGYIVESFKEYVNKNKDVSD